MVFEVAALFADPAALLAANALDFEGPGAAHRILPMGLFVRVPTHCSCANGVRKSVAVRYAARPADTLATVADVVFTGFASEILERWTVDRSELLIGHRFASGAYSRLFRGIYKEQPVAVKFIRQPDDGEDEELSARLEKQFTAEVTILARLQHRNVIKSNDH